MKSKHQDLTRHKSKAAKSRVGRIQIVSRSIEKRKSTSRFSIDPDPMHKYFVSLIPLICTLVFFRKCTMKSKDLLVGQRRNT